MEEADGGRGETGMNRRQPYRQFLVFSEGGVREEMKEENSGPGGCLWTGVTAAG